MRNLISHTKGRTQSEGDREQGAEESISTGKGVKKRREAGEDCIMRTFITSTFYQILLG
jgi:hypothetical protein